MKAIPITIRGTEYPSQIAAARALGVTRQCVSIALKDNRSLDRIGTGVKAVPVTVYGVKYPSYAAAGRALGVSTAAVRLAFIEGRLHKIKVKK